MRETAQALDQALAADRAETGESVAAQYDRLRAELQAADPTADPAWRTLVQLLPEHADERQAWQRLLAAMSASLIANHAADVA